VVEVVVEVVVVEVVVDVVVVEVVVEIVDVVVVFERCQPCKVRIRSPIKAA
jgi:hypothetical protein